MYTRTKELLNEGPAIEPVSVEEVARQCRVTTHDEDDTLASLITAARQHLENICWSAFITQTWDYWWNGFEPKMFIPRPPLQVISSFKYRATTGVLTNVPAGVYETSAVNELPYVRLAYLQSWPTTLGHGDDIHMQVDVGYGDAAEDVPMPIRQAIKLLVAHLFMNRGDGPPEALPPAIDLLIQNYRFKEL